MKKSELKLMIREVVREEIRLGLKEILGEIKTPQRTIEESLNENTIKKINKPKKNYSTNSVLNDVLNETALGEEWKDMGTTNSQRVLQETSIPSTSNNPSDPMNKLLNKDYRGVLEASKQKSKAKQGMN